MVCSCLRTARTSARPAEPCGLENVVLQQMEQDDMPSDIHDDHRVAPERKPLKGSRSATRTSQQSGPPMNDGPELLRSNHC